MALQELRLQMGRRIFDCTVLAVLTLAALFYCYDVEVFPNDSKPHTLELDELLLVLTIFFGGFCVCVLGWLAEERRGIRLISDQRRPGTGREPVISFAFDETKGRWKAGPIENFGFCFGAEELPSLSRQGGLTPAGRPSKKAEIELAIDALKAEGVDLSKLPRKDACLQVRRRAAKLGANVEIGFSLPVVRKVLIERYGPRV
jgi:hypothetical protein